MAQQLDLPLISVEPHAYGFAAQLVVASFVGALLLRRWRRAAWPVLPFLVWLAWRMFSQLSPLVPAFLRADLRHYVEHEFIFCACALVLASALTASALRRPTASLLQSPHPRPPA